jgi:hypothetical protein
VASGSDYMSTPVDFADTLCNVTPISKMESHNNLQGRSYSQPKTFGVVEMMQIQMQQHAMEYQRDQAENAKQEQHDWEENSIREKRQLEELKEEREERHLEQQQQQHMMMMMIMAMQGGDFSNMH